MKTGDKSCTIPESKTTLQLGVNFVNFAYVGDGGGDGLDRTKEGYVEMIEMAAYTSNNCTSIVVTHVGGVPGCQGAKHPLNDNSAQTDASSAFGGLFGGITLINVGTGTDYTEDAVALQRFNFAGSALYFNAGSVSPTLEFSGPKKSVVYEGFSNDCASGGTVFNSDGTINCQKNFSRIGDDSVYWATWEGPECLNSATGAAVACLKADAVSAVLMHNQVMNEYVLDAATKSGTDWVITFPTKRFYVANGTGTPAKLFQKNFNKTAFSCDDVIINIFDREEQTVTTPQSFSPPQPGAAPTSLCYEANVLTFNNTNLTSAACRTNPAANIDLISARVDELGRHVGRYPRHIYLAGAPGDRLRGTVVHERYAGGQRRERARELWRQLRAQVLDADQLSAHHGNERAELRFRSFFAAPGSRRT